MNRRQFVTSTLTAAAVATVAAPIDATGKLGPLWVGMLHIDPKTIGVRLDGVDISNRCIAADDVKGWAYVYDVDANGKKFGPDRFNELAKTVLNGHVEFYHCS